MMAGVSKAVDDKLVARCKKELKAQGVRGETGRRLQAIISVRKYGITPVAEIFGIARFTLSRWIKDFKARGCSAFSVAKGRGRPPKLSEQQMQELQTYIEARGATLTSPQLAMVIKDKFDVTISKTSAYRILKRLNFSYITPRPIHHKKNTAAEPAAIKKSRPDNRRKSES
jgi:transposase